MPVDLWKGFKNASSKGSYYDHNIKGRYRLPLG
ncbi:MAG: KTSC domain-containing protein [Chitinophagaceae bacterium]|nr:KTSC domain-containing protein [Chitinophagaceae bacterium]